MLSTVLTNNPVASSSFLKNSLVCNSEFQFYFINYSKPSWKRLDISCFRDDDLIVPRYGNGQVVTLNSKLHIEYSPWVTSMVNGSHVFLKPELSTGGPNGGGKNGDEDGGGGGGWGGGGDGDDEKEKIFLLPILTMAFASILVWYCLAVWVKNDGFDFDFVKTGIGLLGLLSIAAFRLKCQTGIDAYLLGWGASAGVMVWTVERSFAKKEMSPSGILALFSTGMCSVYTSALYNCSV